MCGIHPTAVHINHQQLRQQSSTMTTTMMTTGSIIHCRSRAFQFINRDLFLESMVPLISIPWLANVLKFPIIIVVHHFLFRAKFQESRNWAELQIPLVRTKRHQHHSHPPPPPLCCHRHPHLEYVVDDEWEKEGEWPPIQHTMMMMMMTTMAAMGTITTMIHHHWWWWPCSTEVQHQIMLIIVIMMVVMLQHNSHHHHHHHHFMSNTWPMWTS